MRLTSWLRAKAGTPEPALRLMQWEYGQANDWDLLDADPNKEALKIAADTHDDAPEDSFRQMLHLAQEGSVYAMSYVAWCYGNGSGVPKDEDQARDWYRLAYENGSERGLLAYGACLENEGRRDEAEEVYEVGYERGFVPAVHRRICLHLKPTLSLAERLTWKPALEWASDADHPGSQFLLTKYLVRGWFGWRGIPRGMRRLCRHFAGIFRREDDLPIPN